VYYQGEICYTKGKFTSTSTEDVSILFLPISDPYIALNKKWDLEGTAILIDGVPAGYYTLDGNMADLTLFKEFKDYWGNILVKLPLESTSIRTINGRPAKDTRFARAFS
jgi:hypothetical protein